MSTAPLPSDAPARPTATAATGAPAAGHSDQAAVPPGWITVICPAGITASAIDSQTCPQPLFARVTYQPA